MIREHDQVVLTDDLPELALQAGDVGVVVHVYPSGAAYEVEFLTLEGETAAIVTLGADKVRAVRKSEIAHVRQLLAA
jgi:hypothetical protein